MILMWKKVLPLETVLEDEDDESEYDPTEGSVDGNSKKDNEDPSVILTEKTEDIDSYMFHQMIKL